MSPEKGACQSSLAALDRYGDCNPLTRLCYRDLVVPRANVSRADADLLRQTNVFLFMSLKLDSRWRSNVGFPALFPPTLYTHIGYPAQNAHSKFNRHVISTEFRATVNIFIAIHHYFSSARKRVLLI